MNALALVGPVDIVRQELGEVAFHEAWDILWSHTSFPFGSPRQHVSASTYYRQALRQLKRTWDQGLPACDHCNRPAFPDGVCDRCRDALRGALEGTDG